MKTIIVLTDFSLNARRAADASLELANKLGYSLTLVNSYQSAIASISVEAVGCLPPIIYDVVEAGSRRGLHAEVRRLRRKIKSNPLHPVNIEIHIHSSADPLAKILRSIANSADLGLVVIGSHQKGAAEFFSDISIDELMSSGQAPLLIFNGHLPIPKKILFATDLAEEDLKCIAKLGVCAKQNAFSLHICNVYRPMVVPDFRLEERLAYFRGGVLTLQEPLIPFTEIEETNFSKSIGKFSSDHGIDMIALAHRTHTFWWKLFHRDHLAEILQNSSYPILILPKSFGS